MMRGEQGLWLQYIQDVNKIPNLYVEPNCAPKSDALGKLDFDRSCLGLNRSLLFVSFPFVLTIVYEGQPGVEATAFAPHEFGGGISTASWKIWT